MGLVLVVTAQFGGAEIALVAAVGAAITVAALVSIEFGILALIFVAAIDGFLKGLSPGWHTQLLKDYVLLICLVRWVWLSVLGHRRRSVTHPISLPVILFMAWVAVQLANARNPGFLLTITNFRAWIIWMPIFFLTFDCIRTRRQIDRFIVFTMLTVAVIGLYAMVQYQVGLDHLFRLGPGFRVYHQSRYAVAGQEDELRPPGTMVSEHALAGSSAMTIMLAAGALGYFRGRRRLQAVAVIALPIMTMALVVTAVRNAFASAVIAMLSVLVLIRRPDIVAIALIIGGIGLYQADRFTGGQAVGRFRTIINQPERTSTRVLGPWRTSLYHVMRYPFGGGLSSGVGRGRLMYGHLSTAEARRESTVPWIENEYGRTLVELGLPGFLLFLWMLFTIAQSIYRAHGNTKSASDRWLPAGIFGATISMLVRLLTGAALYAWPEGILFWCFSAIAVRIPEIAEEEREWEQAAPSEAEVAAVHDDRSQSRGD